MIKDKKLDGKKLSVDLKVNWLKWSKMLKEKLDDYSILPKIRQVLLHWGYELVDSDLFFCSYKNELLLV